MSKITPRTRDREAHRLILDQNRILTSQDIFRLEFGGSLPPEIEKNAQHKERGIKASPIYRYKDFNFNTIDWLACTPQSQESPHKFFFNDIATYTTLMSKIDVMGHEHIHILQNNLKTKEFNTSDDMFKIAHDYNLDRNHSRLRKLFGAFASYYSKDCEIQARLHTLTAYHYRRHQTLPMNKLELWEMLVSKGIPAPSSVVNKMRDNGKHPPGLSLPFHKNAFEMSHVHFALITKENKEAFWNKTLPYLYGHLLELYGYENGREIMGFKSLPVSSDFRISPE